ncbi:cyclin-like f-box [Trichoderma arundinaceum]|uniref:Cyclin-like f-box n=1 Tax=Trichoderma arundinaceum TaxID=490622 RepID=A0A395NZ95_TRIAR|nr:cyclin-like f-box [Trichoderma arundinaceum]
MARVNPAAITTAPGQAPFTLRPLIEDMIKTRRCIPGSVFIVEGIDIMPVPAATPEEDDDAHAVRLLLGDGELCIQALLHPDMFYQVEKRDVFVGCYVRVGNFIMRLEEPEESAVGVNVLEDRGEEDGEKEGEKAMAYLIVNELETAGWNETYMAMWRRHEKGKEVEKPSSVTEDVAAQTELSRQDQETVSTEAQTTPKAAKPRNTVVRFAEPQISPTVQTPTKVKGHDRGKAKVSFEMPGIMDDDLGNDVDEDDDDDDDLEDAFEAFEALGDDDDKSQQQQPVALPRDWHNHQVPLKLTTLRLIPHLPYAQNWSVNVLAIVASLSPVEPSHLPPGKQRTARIADPSTAKQVHLTVFLDPDEFTPKVGSAVLLVGVKNHRFDGGSLKKYASDGKRDVGKKWWFEDPWELEWLDVAGIKSWWKGMEEYYGQSGSRNAE